MEANNNKNVSFEFASDEMRQNGDNIRRWAQSDNIVLKTLAIEVLNVAGVKK